MSKSELDTVVNQLVTAAHKATGGVALRLLDVLDGDGEPTRRIEIGPAATSAHDWLPPADLRRHVVGDVESLVRMAKKYTDSERGLVMGNLARCVLVLEEVIEESERETVTLAWPWTTEATAWKGKVDPAANLLSHREMVRFLTRMEHTLDDPTVIRSFAVADIGGSTRVKSRAAETKTETGFTIEVDGEETIAKFPKTINVGFPMFYGDTEARRFEVRVLPVLPERHEDGLRFELMSNTLDDVYRERVLDSLRQIEVGLPDFTVVFGTHGEKDRVFGVSAVR